MAYRQQLYISPATLTNLTVIVKYENINLPIRIATLDDFNVVDDELNTSFALISNCTVTIYSQGYEVKTLNITTEYYEDKHIVLTPTSDYIKTSDGTNDYYIKDKYSRQFGDDLLDVVMTKADSSDVPTAISDLTDDTSTNPIDKADTLTGLTASITELNYTDGVTSNIQTQLNDKVNTSDIWYDSTTSTLYIGVAQS